MLVFALIAASAGCGDDTNSRHRERVALAPDHYDSFTQTASEEAERRLELIRAEIATLPLAHWAGEYHGGDGLGMRVQIALAPKSGFVYRWDGCLGNYDLNWGEVREVDSKLHLDFHFSNPANDFAGCAPVLSRERLDGNILFDATATPAPDAIYPRFTVFRSKSAETTTLPSSPGTR